MCYSLVRSTLLEYFKLKKSKGRKEKNGGGRTINNIMFQQLIRDNMKVYDSSK